MTLHGKSFLAGALGALGGKKFQAENPATRERLAPDFHEASEAEVARALEASAAAFEVYRAKPGVERAKLLDTIADEIEKIGDDLLQRANAETGLPLARLTGERARTCGQLRLFAQVVRDGSWVDARIDPALPDRKPLPRVDLRRMLLPLGPVVVFGSSNFPLAFSVAGGDTASALAAGCTVVVKAHRAHPGTAELVGGAVTRAVAACGLPAGVFSMIHGGGATVGISMVKHPATTAVGFTGSHAAGRALFDAAAARPHPIPVFAEMSSTNPVFLFPGALRERGAAIAEGLLGSFTMGGGQFCTKPGLIVAVRSPETDAFLAKLSELVKTAPNATMLTGGICTAFEENRAKITGAAGVEPLAAGATALDAKKVEGQPSVAKTSVKTFLANHVLATEAFGPFTLVVLADKLADFAATAASLEGQLTATVQASASDYAEARPLFAALEQKVGRVLLNGFPTGVEVCHAMNHGGPYPATSDVRFTSVGTAAMLRFARPICYQGLPDELLPDSLKNANPLNLLRLVNGQSSRDPVR